MVSVKVAVFPDVTVFVVGVTVSEKSGPGTTVTVSIEDVLGKLDASPG